jgi:hypothetical protein
MQDLKLTICLGVIALSCACSSESIGSDVQAITADDPSCTDPTLVWSLGPVVHNPKVHLLPWIPSSASSNQVPNWTLLENFVEDFAELPIASVLSQYPDANGAPAQTVLLSELRWLTTPYPHDGTPASPIDATDIENLIDGDPLNAPFTPDDVYVVLLPGNIEACDSEAGQSLAGHCTFNATDGGATTFVHGWHAMTKGGRVYVAVTYKSEIVDPRVPNDYYTDGYVFTLAHELFEAITDSHKGWRSSLCAGAEIADLCQNKGSLTQVTDASGTHQFFISSEWSNSAHACPLQTVTITAVSPSSAPAGVNTPVTITGTNFVPGNTTFQFVDNVSCSSSTTCTGVVDASSAGAPAGTQANRTVHLTALVGGPAVAQPSEKTTSDGFTFTGTGPQCTGAWLCDGTTTNASFTCAPAPSWTHFQLLRNQAPNGFSTVTTTITPGGVLGQGSNQVSISELGYIPSASETTLQYEVCFVDNTTNQFQCSAPIVLTGTSNHCTCMPTTCPIQMACNRSIPDGCGGTLNCGACGGGASCNAGSCCPVGSTPDGQGGCVCTPRRCRIGTSWDASQCACLSGRV